MTVERRKHARFKVQGRALAALTRTPSVAGHILNVSEGGLSFRYVASQKRCLDSPRLNLLVSSERKNYRTLPFKCVWDSPIQDDFSYGNISTRHCGVKFNNLTNDEKADLESFINNHTAPNTND